jgi:hypothetical protein
MKRWFLTGCLAVLVVVASTLAPRLTASKSVALPDISPNEDTYPRSFGSIFRDPEHGKLQERVSKLETKVQELESRIVRDPNHDNKEEAATLLRIRSTHN